MKEKAQVGDLIRITRASEEYIGKVAEVVGVSSETAKIKRLGTLVGVAHANYVIHRKAGDEDSKVDLTQEPEGTYRIVNGVIVTDETEQAVRIRQAGAELTDLLVRKNHDYGDSFAQQYAKYGLMSALIRMDDKMRRLETLLDSEEQAQVSESLSDTLLDLAGYALLAYVETQKKYRKINAIRKAYPSECFR